MGSLKHFQYCTIILFGASLMIIIIILKTSSDNVNYNFIKNWTTKILKKSKSSIPSNTIQNNHYHNPLITIAAVSCGDVKINETITMVKSAIIQALRFDVKSLHIHVFADNVTLPTLEAKMNEMKRQITKTSKLSFLFEIHHLLVLPTDVQNWPNDPMPCTTQRLFFSKASSLATVDKLLYVDSDVIFVKDLREIWSFFSKMNYKQHTGLVPEHENSTRAWYGKVTNSRTPYYPPLGLNAGVMLMNLVRLRDFDWDGKVITYYRQYKNEMFLADQDMLNIIFHFHPDTVFVLPCIFNYRQGHCDISMNNDCPSARSSSNGSGVMVVHGNNYPVHFEDSFFAVVYSTFKKFNLATDNIETDLYEEMYVEMSELRSDTNNTRQDCSKLIDFIF